jgi:predicted amidohydrolase
VPVTTPDRVAISVLTGGHLMGPREARRIQLANLIAMAPDSDLLVLPYLASYPPFWTVIDRAGGFLYGERSPFPTVGAISPAVAARGIRTLATVFEVVAEGVFYASAVMIDHDGTSRVVYRQQHAINEPGWHERLYFQPGDISDLPLIDVRGLQLGLMLGGDLWVPEAARVLRLAGAQGLLAVLGVPESYSAQASAIAQVRSIENGIPVVWSGGSSLGIESLVPGNELIDPSGTWNVFALDIAGIQASLSRNDPLALRRPSLYSALSRTWQEDSE